MQLKSAGPADLATIENLMQFYNYELSASYPINFAANGLFALQPKSAYWQKPSVKPFLFYVDSQLAGFAVVDDEVVAATTQYNLGYFFIAARFRGRGVGRDATQALVGLFPGAWEIYHLANNQAAAQFWQQFLIENPSVPAHRVREVVMHDEPSVLYSFQTIP